MGTFCPRQETKMRLLVAAVLVAATSAAPTPDADPQFIATQFVDPMTGAKGYYPVVPATSYVQPVQTVQTVQPRCPTCRPPLTPGLSTPLTPCSSTLVDTSTTTSAARLTMVMKLVEGLIPLMVITTAPIATPSMTAGCSGMKT